MPEKQIPATQPEPGEAPGEFDFAKPTTETPRIKRRSLKPKSEAAKPSETPILTAPKPAPTAPAPVADKAQPAPVKSPDPVIEKAAPVAKTAPISEPSTSPASSGTPASIRSTATPSTSPHGTRPATLYYSSQPKKAETPSPMKTIPTASSAASTSSTSAASSTTRPAATTTSRPASSFDYRANVERQSREQKSVGSILNYVVYGLIAFFVLSACLAGYGAHVIFKQLGDQSVTVSDLDKKYADANKDLTAKLAATNDALTTAQTQITRQQDLILKQQDAINRLINATNDNINSIKAEKAARAQETAALRGRVKDLEAKKY